MTHELKIMPKYYEDVLSGKKRFELRKNDRDYNVGDVLRLREWASESYTGRTFLGLVTYALSDCLDYGLMDGFIILGFE